MSSPKYLKVEDTPSLYRDAHSKGIVTTDNAALSEYKNARSIRDAKNQKILQYEDDINKLKCEVSTIKDSLKLILDALNFKG